MANAPQGNNPGGNNQFQGFGKEAPYGQGEKNTELLRAAPMSGAPVAGRALGTPERQRSARRRAASGSSRSAPQGPKTTVLPALPIPYEKQIALMWRQAAAIPGASDLVKEISDNAQKQAAGI
jgi:hypothetical protein